MKAQKLYIGSVAVLLAGAILSRGVANAQREAYENQVSISVANGVRTITANGIPDHRTGSFPGPGNPNSIRPQSYRFTVPEKPEPAEQRTVLGMQDFGIAVNGVPFDPMANEFWNGNRQWQYEPMYNKSLGIDLNNAHVQPTGAYHYHAIPQALLNRLKGTQQMALMGWAADGYPIYGPLAPTDPNDLSSPLKKMRSSYRLKKGTRPSGSAGPGGVWNGIFTADYEYVAGSGDLDESNGRVGKTPEFPEGTYYYVLSENWPTIPRSYRGTPDASFRRGPQGGGGPPRRGF